MLKVLSLEVSIRIISLLWSKTNRQAWPPSKKPLLIGFESKGLAEWTRFRPIQAMVTSRTNKAQTEKNMYIMYIYIEKMLQRNEKSDLQGSFDTSAQCFMAFRITSWLLMRFLESEIWYISPCSACLPGNQDHLSAALKCGKCGKVLRDLQTFSMPPPQVWTQKLSPHLT